jgi:hypothetical protein
LWKPDTIIHKNESHRHTNVQNNDTEISLHFKPMRLVFMNYSV